MDSVKTKFKQGAQKIMANAPATPQQSEEQYMSSIDNWMLVHATKYMPLKNEAGQMYIPTTAMATNFEIPRGTVHFTLNHVVTGHGTNSWDAANIVVLAPFDKTKEINGAPAELALRDTYFFPEIEQGVLLPEGTRIVRPVSDLPDGEIFEIRGNETVYKTTDFTEEQEKLLIKKLPWYMEAQYQTWVTGDMPDYEVQAEIAKLDERGKKMYAAAKDKKTFMRGLMESARQDALAQAARQVAVEATANAMGYRYIETTDEFSETSMMVENTAINAGMNGNSSDKGHSNSVYKVAEGIWRDFDSILYGGIGWDTGMKDIAESDDSLEGLYEYIDEHIGNSGIMQPYAESIIHGTPIDFHQTLKRYVARENNLHKNNPLVIDEKLHALFDKWATRANQEFKAFCDSLKTKPGYDNFVKKLRKMPTHAEREAIKYGYRYR
ncbi:MAG: hypothetical protein IJD52_03935 [Alphaproteobacteria bacterium]|nr:hypothetical protein [Alphaproteobacteria bacterium]